MVSVQPPGETQVGSGGLRTFDGNPLALEQPLSPDLQTAQCSPESTDEICLLYLVQVHKNSISGMVRNRLLKYQIAAPAVAYPDPISHLLPSPLSSFISH